MLPLRPGDKLPQDPTFKDPPPTLLNLLAVNWFVAGPDTQVEEGASPVARSGAWTLYRRAGTVRRASLVFDWRVVNDPGAALEAVAEPGFRPDIGVVLESPLGPTGPVFAPPPGQGKAVGEVTYTSLGPQAASIGVRSSRPAILLVRDVLDDNWHATLDGESVPVLRADYLLQAVAVPEGTHTVVLTYDDPMIGLGLAGSAVALGGLAVLAVILRRREGGTTARASAPQSRALSSASSPRSLPWESPQ